MPILTLQPDESASKDTLISATNPSGNYGTHSQLPAGWSATNYKALIEFDVSSIPVGAIVISATLRLWCESEAVSTDRNVMVHRSLVEWFEGDSTGGATTINGSTWAHRNHIGSVAWTGGSGGVDGFDYATTPTDTVLITTASAYYDFDVAADVQLFIDGSVPNYGWWLLGQTIGGVFTTRKVFSSSSNATAALRPELVVEYEFLLTGDIEGSSQVTGTLQGTGILSGSAVGDTITTAVMLTNEYKQGSTAGTSSVVGNLGAEWHIYGSTQGQTVSTGSIGSTGYARGTSDGNSFYGAHLKGVSDLVGSAAGDASSQADPAFQGRLRGSTAGVATATAFGYAKATGVATVIGCNPVPLLYITDGTNKINGQINMVNLLSEKYGYKLRNYRPQIAQYKEGGRFSSSPLSQGRRLNFRSFENAIDVFELSALGRDQDFLIEYQQELLAFQEAAADYWVSDWVSQPVYLVARAARETNTRYAVIHMMSVPELTNPYAQPFFDHNQAAFDILTLRVERGHWLSSPPGIFDCVEISSQRSWTVSGWQSGS